MNFGKNWSLPTTAVGCAAAELLIEPLVKCEMHRKSPCAAGEAAAAGDAAICCAGGAAPPWLTDVTAARLALARGCH